MLKILWKRGKIAPEEQFLPLSTIFYYLMLDFYVKTGIRFSLRDKRLFAITEVEIMRVDCTCIEVPASLYDFLTSWGLACLISIIVGNLRVVHYVTSIYNWGYLERFLKCRVGAVN